jgi:hypothetical protein
MESGQGGAAQMTEDQLSFEPPARKLAPDPSAEEAFFPVLEEAGRPIGETPIHDRVALSVGRLRGDSQAETGVVSQTFEACLIESKLGFREICFQTGEDSRFERMVSVWGKLDAFRGEKLAAAAGDVSPNGFPDLIVRNASVCE